MESFKHFIVSTAASVPLAWLLIGPGNLAAFVLLSIYGIITGVLIDLDHFLIARYNSGSWKHLSGALRNPLATFMGTRKTFEGNVRAEERLWTHTAILLVSTPLVFLLDRNLAIINLVAILLHIAADLWTYFTED